MEPYPLMFEPILKEKINAQIERGVNKKEVSPEQIGNSKDDFNDFFNSCI